MKRSFLSLALLLTLSAQGIQVPSGWKQQQQDGVVALTPTDLKTGEVFMVLVLPPQPLNGNSLQTWTADMTKQMAAQFGTLKTNSAPQYKAPLWTVSQTVQNGGQTVVVTHYAAPVGTTQAQLVSVLVSTQGGSTSRYANQAASIIASVVQTSGGSATAAKPAPKPTPTGSTAAADEYGLARGSRVGGPVTLGTYRCKMVSSLTRYMNLSLYSGNEYRVTSEQGNELDTSKFKYDAATGKIDIDSDYELYNSDFDEDNFSIFYLDPSGKPVIYGEDDAGLRVYTTTCTYQGKNTQPAPSVVKAQQDAKAAAKAAADAEARRFKWVTAPGNGVQLGQIQAILHTLETDNSAGYSTKEDWALLLKDGWGYSGLRITPHDLDVKKSRQNEPEKWFKWRRQGSEYQAFDRLRNKWDKLPGRTVLPAKSGERLSGTFQYANYVGNTFTGGTSYFSYVSFGKDGTFSDSSSSIGGSSTMSTSDVSVTSSSSRSQAGCSSTTNTTVSGNKSNDSPVAAGGTTRKDNCAANDFKGTYTLDGYTLVQRYANGKTDRTLFFFWDQDKKMIFIGARTYMRK